MDYLARGLKPGVSYSVQVRSQEDGSFSPWSPTFTFTAPLPPAPTQTPTVALTAQSLGYIVNITGQTSVYDYSGTRIYASTSSGFAPGVGNLVATTTDTIQIVNNATFVPIYVKVSFIDAWGQEGPFSVQQSVTPINPVVVDTTAPTVPTAGFSSSSVVDTKDVSGQTSIITVNWTGVADTDLTGYKIKFGLTNNSASPGNVIDLPSTPGASARSTIFYGVSGQTYYWWVASYDNLNNVSAWSATQTMTAAGDTTAPAVPTSPAFVGRPSPESLIGAFAWTAPATTSDFNPGLGIGYYEAMIASDSGFTANVQTTRSQTPNAVFNLPLWSTTYYAKVRAVDTSGNASAYTSNISQTVGADPAMAAANAAQTSANGKNTIYYAANASPPSAGATGDVWFVTDQDYKIRRSTAPGSGSWSDALLGNAAITSSGIDAAKLTVGILDVGRISAYAISASKIAADTSFISQTLRVGGTAATQINIAAGVTANAGKIYSGSSGVFNNTSTGFYLDGDGNFSLKDKLSFNGTSLTVNGTIQATGGYFSGNMAVGSGGTMKLGVGVSGTNSGLYIAPNNYWYNDGTFSIGNPNGIGQRLNIYTNPNLESNTVTGHGGANSATISTSTTQKYQGTYSMLVTCGATVAQQGGYAIFTNLAANTYYTVSGYLYNPTTNGIASGVFLSVQGAGVAGISNSAVTNIRDSWVRVSTTFQTNATPASGVIPYFISAGNPTAGTIFYIDAMLLELGTSLNPYFDGNTFGAAWTGTANLSTSSAIGGAIDWDGITFFVDGNITARSGTFNGNVEIQNGGSLFAKGGAAVPGTPGTLTGQRVVLNYQGVQGISSASIPQFTLSATGPSHIGPWFFDHNRLTGGSGGSEVGLAVSGPSSFWAGGTSGAAPFRIKNDGTGYIGGLNISNENTAERVSNGYFETNITGWQGSAFGWTTATLAQSSPGQGSPLNGGNFPGLGGGSYSLKVSVPASWPSGALTLVSGLTPGQQYTLTLDAWCSGTTGVANYALSVYGTAQGTTVTAKSTWTGSSLTFTATSSLHYVGIITASAGATDIYIDRVSLVASGTLGSYLSQGTNIYGDSGTGYYLNSNGRFSLKNKLLFDGSNLTLNDGTITGGLIRTASSGARVEISSGTQDFRVYTADANETVPGFIDVGTTPYGTLGMTISSPKYASRVPPTIEGGDDGSLRGWYISSGGAAFIDVSNNWINLAASGTASIMIDDGAVPVVDIFGSSIGINGSISFSAILSSYLRLNHNGDVPQTTVGGGGTSGTPQTNNRFSIDFPTAGGTANVNAIYQADNDGRYRYTLRAISSSLKTKNLLGDYSASVDDFMSLQPRRFSWKDDAKAREAGGFILEEVVKLPSMAPFVNLGPDGEPASIDYGGMVAVLTDIVQRLIVANDLRV